MNVLITGATKGIGKAITLKMANEGNNLAICARKINELETLKTELNAKYPTIKVFIKAVDCAIKQEVLAFAADATIELKNIDVLINSVGVFKPSFILDENDEVLDFHMKTNLYAPYYLYKKLAPAMKEKRFGHIFNICSVASLEAIANAGSYCVTKSALLSLNNIMRAELMEHDVKVTAILPGSTLTNSWEGTKISKDEFIQPEDVADTISQILKMSKGANVEQVVIKPIHGQV
ncbi:short-chain dehydrogenase [Pedobacter psychrophilus]|uniref:Short-chain dehydrogenase n=1 Tax=Pedobacter psychrophilus TaxID=1826909 RepID=A0A179DCU6_9SPHI|nr:SDR family oxidoreductase [Pedobacter psychrophilus]OAQ38865.1 short-chain dehydrogenase [Pedobacter psychrophilus]